MLLRYFWYRQWCKIRNVSLAILATVVCSLIVLRLSDRDFKTETIQKDDTASSVHKNVEDILKPGDIRKITTLPSWFDPDVLLQNKLNQEILSHVTAMKSDVVNKSKIERNKVHSQQFIQQNREKDVSTGKRCSVHYVGCFVYRWNPPFFSEQIHLPTISKRTAESCVRRCSLSQLPYAAIGNTGKCICGGQLSSATLQTIPQRCNSKCLDDPLQTCGGEKVVGVYRIINPCSSENITSTELSKATIGCYAKSMKVSAKFSKEYMTSSTDASQCLLYCEKNKKMLAALDSFGVCQCGQFDKTLSLRHLGPAHQDSFCDKQCPKGSPICSNLSVKILRTNIDDPRCSTKKFVNPVVGRLVALISFPGSGNTWARYLIESATGIYTGSVYKDGELYRKGFLGELINWNSKRTSVIKTHEMTPEAAMKFEAAVFIVRNPYDAILAEFNRLKGGDHVGNAEESLFKSGEWLHFISYKIEKWLTTIESYSTVKTVLVIFFENIVSDPIKEVRKIVSFLKYPVENLEDRLACLESNMGGNFRRTKRDLSFDPFPESLKTLVNLRISSGRRKLLESGLPVMPKYER